MPKIKELVKAEAALEEAKAAEAPERALLKKRMAEINEQISALDSYMEPYYTAVMVAQNLQSKHLSPWVYTSKDGHKFECRRYALTEGEQQTGWFFARAWLRYVKLEDGEQVMMLDYTDLDGRKAHTKVIGESWAGSWELIADGFLRKAGWFLTDESGP